MNPLSGRIQLDFHSDEPIFMQIAGRIEELVVAGTFKPGDQLPTVRELAVDLRINFSTVARAYRILDDRRLISTQRGRGTYIEQLSTAKKDPPQADKRTHRAGQKLEGLAQRFVREAARSGASIQQVRRAFEQQLDSWKRDHPTESGNSSGGS